MDAPVGPRAIDQFEGGEFITGKWIEQWTGPSQRLLDEPAHLPTGETGLTRRGIDGHHPSHLGSVALFARGAHDDVHDGIGHLTLPLVVTHFAKEERLHAEGELTFTPGLIEEDDLKGVAVVAHGHLDHDATLASTTAAHFFHLAVHRGLVAHIEIGQIDSFGPIEVATRVDRQ